MSEVSSEDAEVDGLTVSDLESSDDEGGHGGGEFSSDSRVDLKEESKEGREVSDASDSSFMRLDASKLSRRTIRITVIRMRLVNLAALQGREEKRYQF